MVKNIYILFDNIKYVFYRLDPNLEFIKFNTGGSGWLRIYMVLLNL